MPDLNLIDDTEMEESQHEPEQPAVKGGGGGISFKTHIVLLLILSILLGGGYFLWKKGIFPFKKKAAPVVTQVQEEGFPQEQQAQQFPEQQPQQQAQQAQSDSAEVALLETPLPEEEGVPTKKDAAEKPKGAKAEATPKSEEETVSSAKLSDMKGDFTVQVIAFREEQKAKDIAKNLEFVGYPSFVEKVPMKGGDWYTVRIGRYATRQDAKKAVESFGAQLRANYVINRVRSK